MDKKLKVGWFSFTCCEDSTIMFTELLNTHYKDWLKKIDFVHARVFRRDDTKEIKEMDVAFVEGAISSDRQKNKLLKIREKAKVLVAIGSCAALGSPSNQRNFFNRENLEEISPILEKFKYLEKVLKVPDVVKVDKIVHGCPMNEIMFVKLMKELIA
jgi:coenzyme F420-reducing hydrogenase gamma subunit